MRTALEAAVRDDAPRGVNPRVGCVLVKNARVIGVGQHRGAGTPHAEIDALSSSSENPAGATAVVTLEPCAHTGRTGHVLMHSSRRASRGWCSRWQIPRLRLQVAQIACVLQE